MKMISHSQIQWFENLQQAPGHFVLIFPILHIREAKENVRIYSNINDTELYYQNAWLQGYWSHILVTSKQTDGTL